MEPVRIGTWYLHPDSRELRRGDESKRLTELERDLLVYLVEHAGHTIPVQQLLRAVWSYAPNVRTRAVTNLVGRLRRKLGTDGERLVSVYGQGYRLDVPDDVELVGRRDLLRRLEETLAADGHVTLCGLGGVGKTSIARALAATHEETIWIAAEGLTEEPELIAAVARGLGLAPGRISRAMIGRLLHEQGPELVVVDGAEGLGPDLHDWLAAWRAVHPFRVLVTSRIQPERRVALRVDPLDREAAATLFDRHARVQAPDGVPAEVVEEIVQLVSGLPLALELAAARLRLLDAATLLADLQRDVAALGQRAGSLRAVLEASWTTLDDVDRHALTILCHAPRGLDVDTLQAASGLDRWVLLDAVEVLVRSALVVDDRRQLSVLGVIRRFVELRPLPEATDAFLRWAVQRADVLVADKLTDPDWSSDALLLEAPTLARALALAEAPDDRAALTVALFHHGTLYGRVAQLRPALDALCAEALSPGRAFDVRHARASTDPPGQSPAEAVEEAREALALAQTHGTPSQVARGWNRLVFNRLRNDGPAALDQDVEAMVRAADAPGVPWPVARKSLVLASDLAGRRGRIEEARALAERALADTDPASTVGSEIVGRLAWIHQLRGEPERGLPLAEQAHAAARRTRLPMAILFSGVRLLYCAWESQRGDLLEKLVGSLWTLAGDLGLRSAVAQVGLVMVDVDPELARTLGGPTTFEEVAELAAPLHIPTVEGLAWCEAGFVRHRDGDLEGALDCYQRARDAVWAGDVFLVEGIAAAWSALARWAAGEPDRAREILASAPAPTGQTRRLFDLVTRTVDGLPALERAPVPRLLSRTLDLCRSVGPGDVVAPGEVGAEGAEQTTGTRSTRRSGRRR